MRTQPPRPALWGPFAAAVAALALALTAIVAAPAAAAPPEDDELRVMAFNLRFASDTGANSWPERRPVVRSLLLHQRPHVIGTQEGLFEQLKDIQQDLPGRYDSIGLGREGGSRGEAMQVFYDTQRLEPLEYDHYWLSDTPDVIGSKTWGGCCPRMVTWVRFRDLVDGGELYLLNTHLEAFDATTRALSADLILQRAVEDFDPDLPVVLTGDFNEPAAEGRTVYDTLVTDGPFVDTWQTAETRSELFGTFHGYGPLTPGGDRIDWVLTTPDVVTRHAEIDTYSRRGQLPSDHLPVVADLVLPAPPVG
ncbi:endonuclease/exonuclease/phosphatase family protein [Jannaschia sp. R86511]|uniref:endonuclease/exonuclease/phosphatase family protein n=1 Tax=Jannaschia sp. R86511 TaxID=3093853 RepID=UPI0036D3FECA